MDYKKELNKIEIKDEIRKILHYYEGVITTKGGVRDYYIYRLKTEHDNMDKLLEKYVRGG